MVRDSLARAPRAPIIHSVKAHVSIGTGDNRIDLMPLHTDQLDRMLMVYLPGRRLVYTAEAIQLYPTGLSFPATAMEAVAAVQREQIEPETFMGMHVAATPWKRLLAVLDSLSR